MLRTSLLPKSLIKTTAKVVLASLALGVGGMSADAQDGYSDQVSPSVLMASLKEVDASNPLDPQSEVLLHQSVLSYTQERHEDALRQLNQLDSERTVVAFFKGLAMIKAGNISGAIQTLQPVRNHPEVGDQIDVAIAIAFVESGRKDEGLGILRDYIAAHPEDAEAKQVLQQLETGLPATTGDDIAPPPIEPPVAMATIPSEACLPCYAAGFPMPCEEGRPWNLTFLTGYQYDSNVVRSPTFQGLGSDIQREDSGWVNALFGDYRLLEDDMTAVGVTGSFFHNQLFQIDDLSLTNTSGGAYANRRIGDRFLTGVNYQFHNTLLGGDQFSNEHRLVFSGSYLEGESGHTTVYYEFDNSTIDGFALIPAQEQSGNANTVGVTQAIYLLDGLGRLYGGYKYLVNDADGDDFDFRSNMVTTRLEIPFLSDSPWLCNTIADAEVRVFWDDYDNPNSLDFFENVRSDTRTEVRAGLQRYLTDHFSIRADYTYMTSDSNVANLFGVEFYSFDRHVLSTQLIYDF